MSFLAPLMLVGILGVAVPIAIHLIGRRRAPVRRFGAIDFLLGTDRRVARRLRLREAILLAVRVLSCLAIPLVLAKPFVSCTAQGLAVQRGPQAVVLAIDNSFVMGARPGGDETLFAEAKRRARAVLQELGPEADIAVVYTAEGSDAPGELSRDHLRLGDAIAEAPLSNRPADTALTLRRAATLLATSPHAARRIYLFSALAATGFPPGEPPWAPGGGPELHVVPIPDQPIANVAVIGASAEKDPDLGPRGVRVTAKLANYGPTKVVERAVTLRIAGRAAARGLITIGPGEKGTKRFSATLPPDVRVAEVVVEVDADALPIDDRRYLRVELRRDVRVLLVDGDPRTARHDDELFYLTTALRPGDRADSALAVTTTTPDELPRRRLADYDVVFLCNVKPLDPARVAELEAWVRKGGGLVVSVGDHVDADAYNAAMAPLLPQELRTARQLAAGPKGPDALRVERLSRIEPTHPIFKVFSARAAGLREAAFWKIMLVGPAPDGDEERSTLASFSGGAPALIEARRGAGRVLLFTSTFDRDWNDLPIHPGYLPFAQQVARYLARSPVQEPGADLLVGRSRELPVAAEDTRLEIATPAGPKAIVEGARLRGRSRVTFGDTGVPGFYGVSAFGDDPTRPRPAGSFVVNLDPRGSDPRRPPPEALPRAGGDAAQAAAGPARRPTRRVELWHGLAAALLLFLFSEALLTRRG